MNRLKIAERISTLTNPPIITIPLFLIICIVQSQLVFNLLGATNEQQGTVVFSLFAFSALFNAFNCREFGLNSILPNPFPLKAYNKYNAPNSPHSLYLSYLVLRTRNIPTYSSLYFSKNLLLLSFKPSFKLEIAFFISGSITYRIKKNKCS